MKKRILITIGVLMLIVVPIVAVKFSQIMTMIAAGESFVQPPEAVSSFEVEKQTWRSRMSAVGTVAAVRAVTVSTEVPGTVSSLRFESGQKVKVGEVLLRLDSSVEQAELNASIASGRLATINYERAKRLRVMDANSRADFDSAEASSLQADAEITRVRATLEKKTIRAPFAGRLGIRRVDPGQFLSAGDPVVDLITLAPIYVDFLLPQRTLAQLEKGLDVEVIADAFPDERFVGTLQTINARVEEVSRNVRLRAIFDNPGEKLRPGMFVEVRVDLPDVREVVVVPSTAVLYAPFGDSVYVIETSQDEGQESLVANQRFVRIGETRGDFVAIESGIEAGEKVVSAGGFKLRNAMAVVVNNEGSPALSLQPEPENK